MSVPKQHHSKLRRKRGRTRFVVKPKGTKTCPKCDKQMISHKACPFCGYYKGKEVINTLKKKKAVKK